MWRPPSGPPGNVAHFPTAPMSGVGVPLRHPSAHITQKPSHGRCLGLSSGCWKHPCPRPVEPFLGPARWPPEAPFAPAPAWTLRADHRGVCTPGEAPPYPHSSPDVCVSSSPCTSLEQRVGTPRIFKGPHQCCQTNIQKCRSVSGCHVRTHFPRCCVTPTGLVSPAGHRLLPGPRAPGRSANVC